VLDGPLAFDNAISLGAARSKGILSAVAGQADILVVPDIEAGSMLAKQLAYFADALAAGIVLGARVPIALPDRADDRFSRMAAAMLVQVVVRAGQRGRELPKPA
jgi:phosphotransacetylase